MTDIDNPVCSKMDHPKGREPAVDGGIAVRVKPKRQECRSRPKDLLNGFSFFARTGEALDMLRCVRIMPRPCQYSLVLAFCHGRHTCCAGRSLPTFKNRVSKDRDPSSGWDALPRAHRCQCGSRRQGNDFMLLQKEHSLFSLAGQRQGGKWNVLQ